MKWMYWGQLSEGGNSIMCYLKGINIIEAMLKNCTVKEEFFLGSS